MLKIMIECARTGRLIATGIETDPNTFHSLSEFEAKTFCAYCNRQHLWSKKEACLERRYSSEQPLGARH